MASRTARQGCGNGLTSCRAGQGDDVRKLGCANHPVRRRLDLEGQFWRAFLAAPDLGEPALGHADCEGQVTGLVFGQFQIGIQRHAGND